MFYFQDTECQICHKKLRKRNLPGHLKTHEGYDGIPCSVCGKEFPTIGGKNRHEKIHFEVKQHTCRLNLFFVIFEGQKKYPTANNETPKILRQHSPTAN